MSWDKIEGKNYGGVQKTVRIRIERSHKLPKYHRLIVMIGRAVAKQIGWDFGTRVDVYWGSGNHKGHARLEERPDGMFVLRRSHQKQVGGSLYLDVAQLPADGPREYHGVETVGHGVSDRTLDIKLPSWFYAKYEKKQPEKSLGRKRLTSSEDKAADKTVLIHESKSKSSKSDLTSGLNGNAGV